MRFSRDKKKKKRVQNTIGIGPKDFLWDEKSLGLKKDQTKSFWTKKYFERIMIEPKGGEIF